MPIENVLSNSRIIKAITFILMASMILLSMIAGAGQDHSHKKTDHDLVKARNGVTHVSGNVILPSGS
jgi:hypothetical protein